MPDPPAVADPMKKMVPGGCSLGHSVLHWCERPAPDSVAVGDAVVRHRPALCSLR